MYTVDSHGWTILDGDTGYGVEQSIRTATVAQGPVDKYVKHRKCAVEIGVHYGFTTRWLCSKFDMVHTFDLDNSVLKCFEMNMEKFNCKNVISHKHGLGSQNQIIDYPYRKKGEQYPAGWDYSQNKTRFIAQKQIVKKLDEFNLAPNFVIIDAEGYGEQIMQGAVQTFVTHKPVVVCKLDGAIDVLENKLGYTQVTKVTKNDVLCIHKEQI